MDILTEEWRPVVGAEGRYEVSNRGRVRSLVSGGMALSPAVGKSGYQQVSICGSGIGRTQYVHQLVASAFIGERPEAHNVDHINGNRTDNRVENLRYLRISENCAQGTCIGERQVASKLNDVAASVIRRALSRGVSQALLGRLHGVSTGCINHIAHVRSWRHAA